MKKKHFLGIIGVAILGASGISGIENIDIKIELGNGQTIIFETKKACNDVRDALIEKMGNKELSGIDYLALMAVKENGCRDIKLSKKTKDSLALADEIITDAQSYIFYNQTEADDKQSSLMDKLFTNGDRISQPEAAALGDLVSRSGQEVDLKKAKKELKPRFNNWFDGEEINIEEFVIIKKIIENAGGLQMSGEVTQEQLREKINEILSE